MAGTIAIIVVLLLIPVGFLMSTAVAAGVIGWALKRNSADEYEDSELLDCNY